MGHLQIALSVASIVCAAIAIYFSFKADAMVKRQMKRKLSEPGPKKVVIPGKGIFSTPPPKKTPKYWSDQALWEKEQDDKRR